MTAKSDQPGNPAEDSTSSSQDLVWPRSKVMTERKLVALRRNGRGAGDVEEYQPWIRVRRSLSSPVSNLYVWHTPLYARRGLHLLSGIERSAALAFLWLGATEIREQFPMWPDAHSAPCFLPGLTEDRTIPGLLEIADLAGIEHGVYPGTSIPYVGTIDLMTLAGMASAQRLFAISCKPKDKLVGDGSQRVNERLELERLYALELNATSIIFHEQSIPKQLATNLDWFMPTHSELLAFRSSTRLADFAGAFNLYADNDSIFNCRKRAAHATSLADTAESHAHFRAAVWLGLIDMDLTRQVRLSRPIVRDVLRFKASLIDQLIEDSNECRSLAIA